MYNTINIFKQNLCFLGFFFFTIKPFSFVMDLNVEKYSTKLQKLWIILGERNSCTKEWCNQRNAQCCCYIPGKVQQYKSIDTVPHILGPVFLNFSWIALCSSLKASIKNWYVHPTSNKFQPSKVMQCNLPSNQVASPTWPSNHRVDKKK